MERPTSAVTSCTSSAVSAKKRGRKQVRRDKSKVYRENVDQKAKPKADSGIEAET